MCIYVVLGMELHYFSMLGKGCTVYTAILSALSFMFYKGFTMFIPFPQFFYSAYISMKTLERSP